MDSAQKPTSKKLARMENKKKKMLALLTIARLNDSERAASNLADGEPEHKKIRTEPFNDDLQPTINTEPFDDDLQPTVKTESLDDDQPSIKADSEDPTMNSVIGKPVLTGEDYEKLRKELKERKQRLKNFPNFRLKQVGEDSSLTLASDERIPLFLSDLQHLLLFTHLGNHSSYFPHRWCTLERLSKVKHNILFVVENMSLLDYTNNDLFPNLNSNFSHKLELVTPSVYKGDLVEEIIAVPLTTTQKDHLVREYGSLDDALQNAKVFKMLKAVFPVQERNKVLLDKKLKLPPNDKFPRTHLLLSAWQLVEENYPLPLKGSLKHRYSKYVMTKDVYEDVTEQSPLFALDCEMCRTTSGELELTRVSVVNEQHELIYEKLVKPYNRITDYLTQFSGITADMLKDVTTRIEEVQNDLRAILPPDAILVGQSLNSDLHALKLVHPYIIDTSVIFNVTGDRYRKTKLKVLAKEFLDLSIQTGKDGHNSVEDSLSSLKLVQLKLKNYIEFGDAVLSGQKNCSRNYKIQGDNYYGTSLLHHVTKHDKKVQIIAKNDDIQRYSTYIHKKEVKINTTEKESNKQIIKHLRLTATQYEMSIAHLKLSDSDISDENIEETCKSVDRYVQRVWQHCPNNTLAIVLFGGNFKSNGAAFINVKKDMRK